MLWDLIAYGRGSSHKLALTKGADVSVTLEVTPKDSLAAPVTSYSVGVRVPVAGTELKHVVPSPVGVLAPRFSPSVYFYRLRLPSHVADFTLATWTLHNDSTASILYMGENVTGTENVTAVEIPADAGTIFVDVKNAQGKRSRNMYEIDTVRLHDYEMLPFLDLKASRLEVRNGPRKTVPGAIAAEVYGRRPWCFTDHQRKGQLAILSRENACPACHVADDHASSGGLATAHSCLIVPPFCSAPPVIVDLAPEVRLVATERILTRERAPFTNQVCVTK